MSVASNRAKVLVLGGSLINGLGCDSEPFGHLVGRRLGAQSILDLSQTSQTCAEMLARHKPAVASFRADLAVLMIAGSDSLVRPGHRVQHLIERYAPATWHGVAGLEPRARFSGRRRRRLRQRIESSLKVAVKHLLFRILGGGRPRTDFTELARDVVELLTYVSMHSDRVVVVGLPDIDPALFPGSTTTFERANTLLEEVTDAHANMQFLSLRGALKHWEHYLPDHLHLNPGGHERVASLIERRIAA